MRVCCTLVFMTNFCYNTFLLKVLIALTVCCSIFTHANSDTCSNRNPRCLHDLIAQCEEIALSYSLDIEQFVTLHDVLEKLISVQKDVTQEILHHQRTEFTAMNFERWCQQEFGMRGLSITQLFDGDHQGWGLTATTHIAPNMALMLVPLNHTIHSKNETAEVIDGMLFMPEFVEARFLWSDLVYLTMEIIRERLNSSSYFKPNLDFLPTNFSYFLYFTPEEVALLQGSRAFATAIHTKHELVMQYAQIHAYLSTNSDACERFGVCAEKFTFELFRWATAIALTRSFIILEFHRTIVPCFDMVNHRSGSKNLYSTITNNSLIVHSVKSLFHGTEALTEYHTEFAPVDHYFMIWGIAGENATMLIRMFLRPMISLRRLKLAKLEALDLPSSYMIIVMPPGSQSLFYTEDSLTYLDAFFTARKPHEVTAQSRKRALRLFARYIRFSQTYYHHSQASAKTALEEGKNLTMNAKMILQNLVTEHYIMNHARTTALLYARKGISHGSLL